jgi:Zn-dependent peptidase ImmA (M78 family)
MIKSVNPKIIIWARKRLGLSVEELAYELRRDPNEVEMWERGEKGISYTTLSTLAYSYFKLPLAVFFFPEPPEIDDPAKKFRRLPDCEFEKLSLDIRKKIFLAQAYQDSLSELLEETSEPKRIYRELNPQDYTLSRLALEIRKSLGITIDKQIGFRSQDQAFKAWRVALEKVGVFTFKDSFKDKSISGFCLIDDDYPVIMVNNSNSFARQTFTLFHELGHILFGVNGITDIDESYINDMKTTDKNLEVYCNHLASEILVPTDIFKHDIKLFKENGFVVIPELAKKYSVSKEVILRRLLDQGVVTNAEYLKKSTEWNKDYLRGKTEESGGNWYLTKISYVGETFSRVAFEQYKRRKFDKATLASHLNVKARKLNKYADYLG